VVDDLVCLRGRKGDLVDPDPHSVLRQVARLRTVGGDVPERLHGLDQAEVVLPASWAAHEVCGETRMRFRRVTASELLLDVTVENLESRGAAGVHGLREEHRLQVPFLTHSAPSVT
jgi:hypothetical protein